eukprot:c10991_g1_i1 orf=266-418(+)
MGYVFTPHVNSWDMYLKIPCDLLQYQSTTQLHILHIVHHGLHPHSSLQNL